MSENRNSRRMLFPLLIICTILLVVVVFLLVPLLRETVSLSRDYSFQPDTWVYYGVLACCGAAFLCSLFLIFHNYMIRGKRGREQSLPE